MADTFTQTSTFASDTAAYEALAYFALRPQLYFDAVADVKPTNQTHRGASVQFNIYTDVAAQTSTLSETADPDAIAASDTTVVVTPLEKGAVMKSTAKLKAQSFLDIDTDLANLIGYSAGLSLDTLARTQLEAGTNVRYGEGGTTTPTARNNVTPSDTLNADNVRRARADLVKANVPPVNGPLYWAFIHPDVAFDLRKETGAAAWRDPHTYSAPELIWSGETGAFEGFRSDAELKPTLINGEPWNGNPHQAGESRAGAETERVGTHTGDATVRSATNNKLQLTQMFIETPRAPVFADAGSSPTTTDVIATLIKSLKGVDKSPLNIGNAETPTRGKPKFVTPTWYDRFHAASETKRGDSERRFQTRYVYGLLAPRVSMWRMPTIQHPEWQGLSGTSQATNTSDSTRNRECLCDGWLPLRNLSNLATRSLSIIRSDARAAALLPKPQRENSGNGKGILRSEQSRRDKAAEGICLQKSGTVTPVRSREKTSVSQDREGTNSESREYECPSQDAVYARSQRIRRHSTKRPLLLLWTTRSHFPRSPRQCRVSSQRPNRLVGLNGSLSLLQFHQTHKSSYNHSNSSFGEAIVLAHANKSDWDLLASEESRLSQSLTRIPRVTLAIQRSFVDR